MADEGPKTRLRRTRTGCFKCRTRRRKCDEGKPSCQRCLDGGFDCQYGTRLSFLDKNAKTGGSESRPSKSPYNKLRFVVPESSEAKSSVQLQQDHASPPDSDVASASATESSTTRRGSEVFVEQKQSIEHSSNEQPPPEPPSKEQPQIQSSASDSQPRASPVLETIHDSHDKPDPPSYGVGISPDNAAYETALDGLLSLGSDHYAPAPPPPPPPPHPAQPGVDLDLVQAPAFFGSPQQPQHQFSPSQVNFSNQWLTDAFQNCAHMPQDRAVRLLRHYRYNIAPWLDIGDSSQTFALLLPRVAMESAAVFDSVLALSMTTLGEQAEAELGDAFSFIENSLQIPPNDIYDALAHLFAALRRQVLSPPHTWRSIPKALGMGYTHATAVHPAISLAASWVLLRLEISVGLMNAAPVYIPDLLLYSASAPRSDMSQSLKLDREPVILCAQVLNYCYGDDVPATSSVPSTPSKPQMWKSLSEALNMWYTNRPREFKPMLEMEDGAQLFPVLLYTNGAAVLANQLYHTAMLLLLQNRPRTLPRENTRSVIHSPLWHAQRICGICLNNDSSLSWDFSLLVSLYVAAKRMTYDPQQQAILQSLDRIGDLTGWNLSNLSAQLVLEWQPD